MTFEKKTILYSFILDLISGILIFCYSLITIQFPKKDFFVAFAIFIPLLVVLQFLIAPITAHIAFHKISDEIELFKEGKYGIYERTRLLDKLLQYPAICGLMTFAYFVFGTIFLFLLYRKFLDLNLKTEFLFLLQGLLGSFFAALITHKNSYQICRKTACDIVKEGVDDKYILSNKPLGHSFLYQTILYIALPSLFTALINIFIIVIGYYPLNEATQWTDKNIQLTRMFFTCILNSLVQIILIIFYYKDFHNGNKKMTSVLQSMLTSDIKKSETISTDISDDFAYNHYLANNLLSVFKRIIETSITIGNSINNSAEVLSKIAMETESTSIQQSAGTREIAATMESTATFAHSIESKVTDVANQAASTSCFVNKGSEILNKNITALSDMEDSNDKMIHDIKELNTMINNICEIVSAINNISDQTKIIAFNAELESANSFTEKKNFKKISDEIRCLANSTEMSIKDIQKTIEGIQLSSETLIDKSRNSTRLIQRAVEMADTLQKSLQLIKSSSDEDAVSSEEIKNLTQKQTQSFYQISQTLQQLSIGIQSFSQSTRIVIDTANSLRVSVKNLEHIAD